MLYVKDVNEPSIQVKLNVETAANRKETAASTAANASTAAASSDMESIAFSLTADKFRVLLDGQ